MRAFVSLSEEIRGYLRENARAILEFRLLLNKIQASIPQRMLTSCQDSIHFVDALGRTRYLPDEFFRYFEVFESLLRREFKGLPGERKIMNGDYSLVNGLANGELITRDTWEQMVFPGNEIKMAVVLYRHVWSLRGLPWHCGPRCPRPQCSGILASATSSGTHCPICNLVVTTEISEKKATEGILPIQASVSRGTVEELKPMNILRDMKEQTEREEKEILRFCTIHIVENVELVHKRRLIRIMMRLE